MNLSEQLSIYRDAERLDTNNEQTKTLLSLGFPKPARIRLTLQGDIIHESSYSIEELLMWITPYSIEKYPEYGYKIVADCEPPIIEYNTTLIDGLYEVIIKLYKAGQYNVSKFIEEDITL